MAAAAVLHLTLCTIITHATSFFHAVVRWIVFLIIIYHGLVIFFSCINERICLPNPRVMTVTSSYVLTASKVYCSGLIRAP